MSMLDRRSRTGKRQEGRGSAEGTVPTATGPDEPTVRLATKDFRKRRRQSRRSRRWRQLRLVLAAVLTVAVVVGAIWAVFFSSLLTVTGVEVTGNGSVPTTRIEQAADVPTGTPLARVDLAAIQAKVEAIPAVRLAEVSRAWPHQVHVVVVERTPVAVINRGNGLQAMDAAGVLFGSYGSRPAGLPLVRTQPGTSADALAEGGKVIASLPANIARRIDYVEVDSIDAISLKLRSGRTVMWGSSQDSAQKAEVLAVLLKRPGQTIDVTVPGRPTTR